ncbi:MAG: DNA-processing protein DprA, partial [Kiloniellales bacterium]|nr:DNA-processing protein DprA [Kiloniellales bacterium]
IKICPKPTAEHELRQVEKIGGTLIAACEDRYPDNLASLEDAPPLICVLGHPHLLGRKAVALVGARNASANGRKFAEKLAQSLGESGYLVVSGLARGIDTAAHQGALEKGTAAVVAGGADVIYPKENAELHQAIAEQGVILSELPPGVQPQARHFPRRNRIIAGLSLGVVVVEAAVRSGSLITARLAADQGRLVFAVPGSPVDPRSQGCNRLLKDGAILVESAADIIADLDPMVSGPLHDPTGSKYEDPPGLEPDESELRAGRIVINELLSADPVSVDELLRQCQMSHAVVQTVLLEMELAGLLERHPGNRVARIFPQDSA